MLSVRLPHDLEKRLSNLAKRTERTKSAYIRKALQTFLESEEKYLLAEAAFSTSIRKAGNSSPKPSLVRR